MPRPPAVAIAVEASLLDAPVQQFLDLGWRGSKITHASRQHDHWANIVASVVGRHGVSQKQFDHRVVTLAPHARQKAYGRLW